MAQFAPRLDAPQNPANLIEGLGAELAARYADAEADMISRVSTLAARNIDTPPAIADRLQAVVALRREGERIARDLADPVYAARVVQIAAEEGRAAALDELRAVPNLRGASDLSGTAARAVGLIELDLIDSLDAMNARITRWMPDAYQQVLAITTPQVILGTTTVTLAQRRAAERFLARGVTGFTDRAGRDWRIGTYAEMATRTTVNRAWQQSNIATMQQAAGVNLVKIVIGLDACSTCASFAGRVWSTDGTPAGTYELEHVTEDRVVQVTVAGTLQSARDGGWNHPNCRCTVVAYLPGLTLTSEGSAHDPQAEADRDRLRELERRVRDLKRREAAAFDDITKADLRRSIREQQARIRDHVATSGQVRKSYREQLGFSDGRTP